MTSLAVKETKVILFCKIVASSVTSFLKDLTSEVKIVKAIQ